MLDKTVYNWSRPSFISKSFEIFRKYLLADMENGVCDKKCGHHVDAVVQMPHEHDDAEECR